MGVAVFIIAQVLDKAIAVYVLLIVIRSVISWFRPNPRHRLIRFLDAVTDPVLEPVRELIHGRLGLNLGGLDISPLVVILALVGVRAIVVNWLLALAARAG